MLVFFRTYCSSEYNVGKVPILPILHLLQLGIENTVLVSTYCCIVVLLLYIEYQKTDEILPRLLYFVCAADIGDDFTSSLWLSVSFLISTFADLPEKRLNRFVGQN